MVKDANYFVEKIGMLPHPEGGFYKETYRSKETLVNDDGENRNVSTSIYYLLENEDKSHFHRIKSDELWYFHSGQALEIVSIQNHQIVSIILGNDIENGEVPQAMIPANTWFASHVKDEKGFTLVSCSVAPGFDFADFEMAERENLVAEFPGLSGVIEKFTRE